SQLGHVDDALKVLARFKLTDQTDRPLSAQIFELSARLKLQRADALGSIDDLVKASEFKVNPADRDALLSRASEIVGSNLSSKQLKEFVGNNKYPQLEIVARYR